MKLFFVLPLIFAYSNLIACSCGTISKINKDAITKVKDIFIGKVIKVEPNDNQSRKITFKLTQNLKTDGSGQIVVYTGLGGGDCGLNVKEGQEWYIFSYGDNNGKSWAGRCGRSALLSEHSIPSNSDSNKYYRKSVRQYKKDKARAQKEIKYIRGI